VVSRTDAYQATDGAAYEVFLGRRSRRLAEKLLDFAALGDDGALLDVGCGTGSLTSAMVARWPQRRIVGVDFSEAFLAFARSRELGEAVVFEQGDATALPYADGTFAGTATQLVLNFIPGCDTAVAEMRRVTRRAGIVAAAVMDFRGGAVFQRLFWDTACGIDPQAHERRARLFSAKPALPGGLRALFVAAGLERIEEDLITFRVDYTTFEDYWRPLLGGQGPIGSYVAALTGDLQARLETAVRAAYCAGAPDGPRAMSASAWAVRGIVP
jgi:ubiquinone/menaquinone biosynthesis C-methylase UbiE